MIELVGKRLVAHNMESGDREYGKHKIFVPNDDGKRSGIRPRWCQVYKVGPDVKDVEPGQWILVSHGRWSHHFIEADDEGNDQQFWVIDYPTGILLISDEQPDSDDLSIGSA